MARPANLDRLEIRSGIGLPFGRVVRPYGGQPSKGTLRGAALDHEVRVVCTAASVLTV